MCIVELENSVVCVQHSFSSPVNQPGQETKQASGGGGGSSSSSKKTVTETAIVVPPRDRLGASCLEEVQEEEPGHTQSSVANAAGCAPRRV